MDSVFDDTLERRYADFDQNISALALDVLENEDAVLVNAASEKQLTAISDKIYLNMLILEV